MIAREIPYYNLLLCLNALRIKIPRLVKYEIASYIGSKSGILGLHFPLPAMVDLKYPGDYEKYDLSLSYIYDMKYVRQIKFLKRALMEIGYNTRFERKTKEIDPYLMKCFMSQQIQEDNGHIRVLLERKLNLVRSNKLHGYPTKFEEKQCKYFADLLGIDISRKLQETPIAVKTPFENVLDAFVEFIGSKDKMMGLVHLSFVCEKNNINIDHRKYTQDILHATRLPKYAQFIGLVRRGREFSERQLKVFAEYMHLYDEVKLLLDKFPKPENNEKK